MEKLRVHINKKTGEKTYHAAIRVKGIKPIYGSFSSEAAALEFQKNTLASLRKQREQMIDPRSWLPDSGQLADQKLRDILLRYQASMHESDTRRSEINGALRVCADPTVGQLFPSWIKKFVLRARKTLSERGKPYAWSTIEKMLSVIATSLKWRAEELDIHPPPFVVTEKAFIDAAKAEGLCRDDLNNERDRRFEPGEEERLMTFLTDSKNPSGEQWKLMVQFAIHTGARLQEMALADWSEICPSGEWWHIPGRHSKTKDRSMVLIDEAMDVLDRMRELRDPASKRIFHGLGTPGSLSDRWAKDAKLIGLEDFRFHDLRHEGISRLVLTQPDLPIKAIMDMVGHSDIKMLNRYAKLRPWELGRLICRRADRRPLNPADRAPRQPLGLEEGVVEWNQLDLRIARKGAQATNGHMPNQRPTASMSS